VEVGSAAEKKSAVLSLFSRSNKARLLDFTKQLATLLNSGIKLTEALSVLALQAGDSRFKNALTDIRDRVITGESFTDALRDYGDYFDIIYVSMVHVGEVTGSLGTNLETIAGSAMIYPVVLVLFLIVAILILTIKVIPTIGEQIVRTGQELPWITRQLMNVGYIFTSWWLVVVIFVFVSGTVAVKRFLRTERGAFLRDRFLLSLPIFGPLIRQRVVSRFASTLSTLLGSGLAIAESLRVVSEVTGNVPMSRAIDRARERILAGADIATPLRDSGLIEPAIAHMISVGEKSGELETMLKNISENLEASTDLVIERLSAAIEPVIIIFMAVIIGIVAYATLLPIIRFSAGQF